MWGILERRMRNRFSSPTGLETIPLFYETISRTIGVCLTSKWSSSIPLANKYYVYVTCSFYWQDKWTYMEIWNYNAMLHVSGSHKPNEKLDIIQLHDAEHRNYNMNSCVDRRKINDNTNNRKTYEILIVLLDQKICLRWIAHQIWELYIFLTSLKFYTQAINITKLKKA